MRSRCSNLNCRGKPRRIGRRNSKGAAIGKKTRLVRSTIPGLILSLKIGDQPARHLVKLRLVGDRQIITNLHKASKRPGFINIDDPGAVIGTPSA